MREFSPRLINERMNEQVWTVSERVKVVAVAAAAECD